ncbi:MAG TPA: hypothetical protein VFC19_29805 [Candidatus Limnocylindrales bacterium]|nr:hypothetical protein [Candidatus Limnocylindrales bacterium]
MSSNNAAVELRHHGELTAPRAGDELVAVSVGPTGEAVALWSTAAGRVGLYGQGFSGAAPARIATYWPDIGPIIEVADLEVTFPTPAPLLDGQMLVVGARCRWYSSGPQRNAVVFDDVGARVAEGVFGDGIEHVYTTSTGQTWVGYFDEGVFGNLGWGGPGPTPIGAGGIVRFGGDLNPQWSFPLDTSMADCYALNVTNHTVWACYYTGFPIAAIERDRIRHRSNDAASGVRAMIVAGTRCVLVGGYGAENRGRLVVGELADDSFQLLQRQTLALPPGPASLVARGNELNVIIANQWYKLDEQL